MRKHNTNTTNPGAWGAPGAPPEAAPLWLLLCFRFFLAGHVLEISRRVAAPPCLAPGHKI
eukprot:9127358-Heterocapsa_arctica.AAC.1